MATITFLYKLGIVALVIVILSGIVLLFIYKAGNLKAEIDIKRLQDDVYSLHVTKTNASLLGEKISQINQDALDNERYVMFTKLIERYNAKFGIEKK